MCEANRARARLENVQQRPGAVARRLAIKGEPFCVRSMNRSAAAYLKNKRFLVTSDRSLAEERGGETALLTFKFILELFYVALSLSVLQGDMLESLYFWRCFRIGSRPPVVLPRIRPSLVFALLQRASGPPLQRRRKSAGSKTASKYSRWNRSLKADSTVRGRETRNRAWGGTSR